MNVGLTRGQRYTAVVGDFHTLTYDHEITQIDALLIARQQPNKIIDMLYSEPRVIETADSNTQMF